MHPTQLEEAGKCWVAPEELDMANDNQKLMCAANDGWSMRCPRGGLPEQQVHICSVQLEGLATLQNKETI
jgi:hypothetical protein